MLTVIYPSDDFFEVPDIYQLEKQALEDIGMRTAIFDFNEFFDNSLKVKPKIALNGLIMYRGWMLNNNDYQRLFSLLQKKQLEPLTLPEQYLNTHYLPRWYDKIKAFTPKTVFTDDLNQVEKLFKTFDKDKVFIKDFVKSDTSGLSIANSYAELEQIIANLKKYRGSVEGGICLREFVNLDTSTEERYFVFKQNVYARDNIIPELVEEVAKRIDSPFFSVDTCYDTAGKLWIIELGDGQVSDIKKWQTKDFVKIFND